MTVILKPAGRTLKEFQPLKPAEQKLLEACRLGVQPVVGGGCFRFDQTARRMNGRGGTGRENKGAMNRAPTGFRTVGAQFIAPDLPPKFITPDSSPAPSTFHPDIHHRRSIRLRNYDYSQAGAYFITLCTQKRECLFGAVVCDGMRLNDAGCIVQDIWNALPGHYPCVELDCFVVMPNHIHGIVVLNGAGARFIAPDHDGATNSGAMNRAPTLGEITRAFKARCTHGINQLRKTQGASIWQRNYYEHIIRSEPSLQEIREYIANNPAQWAIDRENPDAVWRDGSGRDESRPYESATKDAKVNKA